MIVLNSRMKPGAFPTLCSGTNRLESFVLTVCTNDVVDTLLMLASAGRSFFALQPPYVILLRKDWAEVRRPPLCGGSVKDLGGAGWEGE